MSGTEQRQQQITAHVERHLGPVTRVFRDDPGDMQIDVLHAAPTSTRPVHTLITSGMSILPMQVPAGSDSPRHLELMMTLPQAWEPGESIQDEQNWPVRQLQSLARYPHQRNSWLGWGDVVPNADPPRPLARDTQLCGVIIVPSLLVPTDFYELATGAQTVAFYGAVPLYKEEMAMKSREGMAPLLERLADRGITDLIDLKRRNVAVRKRLFGLF